MTFYRLMSSSTLPPKFAVACAAALGFAAVNLFFGPSRIAPAATPATPLEIVTLPTIVVVPTAADWTAAAALDTIAQAPRKRLDEV
ncbi:MAG TPA: hypothetical protein VLF18_21265 [Tahibacter sp.]|uniref:hypothetical protein n=1 Tax=Tahibacter sp. TaxID=2056211 RepID=UPI002BEBA076|nr:hypothetical protein [Tahibacter sp.]HSX62720.1 hypothetical protein [Tahibacter sp.]